MARYTDARDRGVSVETPHLSAGGIESRKIAVERGCHGQVGQGGNPADGTFEFGLPSQFPVAVQEAQLLVPATNQDASLPAAMQGGYAAAQRVLPKLLAHGVKGRHISGIVACGYAVAFQQGQRVYRTARSQPPGDLALFVQRVHRSPQ